MIEAIHQVLPVLARRDATGEHALEVRQLLRDHGLRSEIFVLNPLAETASTTHPLHEWDARVDPATAILYQCSVGSALGSWCEHRREPLLLDYHNMTPASFYDAWYPLLAAALRDGRRQLARLVDRTTLALADSSFNRAELIEVGYQSTAVAPIILDLDAFDQPSDEPTARRLHAERVDGAVDWLCVGRIVPNKAQHDVIAAFAAWAELTGQPGSLRLVGSGPTAEYEQACVRLASDLGIAERVDFAGSVSHRELLAHYRHADVFVSLSRHEGFCVPVVEAMHLGVPVVALASGAVPETAGNAALLIGTASPLTVAATVDAMTQRPAVRTSLVERGHRRSADFARSTGRSRFLAALAPVLG